MIVLAAVAAATMVGAASGWTAWSEPAGGAYALVLRAPDGSVSRPAIAPRGVPFDVSLGGDAGGRLVATYSRCAREPAMYGGANPRAGGGLPQYATGRGCTVYVLDVGPGVQRSTGVRGVLPAVAGSALAFVRIVRPGVAAVVVRDTATGAERVLQRGRVRRGAPESAEGPTSLDTDGRRVVTAWRLRDRRAGTFDSRIYVQPITEGLTPHLVAGATNTSDTPFVTVFAPALDRGRVHYLLSFGQGYCERRWAPGPGYPAYGVQRSSAPGSPVSAAVDGGRLVVAEVTGSGGEIVAFGPRPFTDAAALGEVCG